MRSKLYKIYHTFHASVYWQKCLRLFSKSIGTFLKEMNSGNFFLDYKGDYDIPGVKFIEQIYTILQQKLGDNGTNSLKCRKITAKKCSGTINVHCKQLSNAVNIKLNCTDAARTQKRRSSFFRTWHLTPKL